MLETILRYILLYFIIISGSIFVKYKTNKKLASSIPIYILTVIVILYIFGLFKGLLIGVYVISIASILFGIYAIIKMPKDKRKEIIDAGTIFFTIIYGVFMITTYKRVSDMWDEYSVWSLNTKLMYYKNIFQVDWYPPMPNIWEYFGCKVIGKYTQGIEMFLLYIVSFSLLLPLFNINKNNNKIYNICISIICICIPTIFTEFSFYEAPFADALIGLILGYIFIERYFNKNEKYYKYTLIVSCIILTITKATGFYITLIILFTYLLLEIINNVKLKKRFNIKQYKFIIILIIITLATFESWNLYSNNNKNIDEKELYSNVIETEDISDFFKSLFTVSIKSLDGSWSADRIQEDLITSIFDGKSLSTYININIWEFLLIYFAIMIIVYKSDKNKEIKYIGIFLGISFILYILFLQITYFLKFDISEAISHNGFVRYVSSYLFSMLIILIAIILDKNIKKNNTLNIILVLIVILAITPIKNIANITINAAYYNQTMNKEINSVIKDTQELKETLQERDNIYVINQQFENNKFQYFMIPEKNVEMGVYFGNNSLNNEKEYFKQILYKYYEYVYIRATDEYFNNNYSEMFNDMIEEKAVYKINKDNGMENIKLERIDLNE